MIGHLAAECRVERGERETGMELTENHQMRSKYLEAVLHQDVGFFDAESKTAEIISTISSDISTIYEVISFKMGKLVRFTTTFLAALAVGLYYSWQLSLLTMGTVPITMIVAAVYNKTAVKLAAGMQHASTTCSSIVEETASQIRTVHSYNCEDKQTQRFKHALAESTKLSKKLGLVKGLGIGGMTATVHLSWALLLWFGGVLITNIDLLPGYVMTAILSIVYGGRALSLAILCFQSFPEARVSAGKIFALIEREPLVCNGEEGSTLPSITGALSLKNVSFRYPSRPNMLALENVSIEILPGKVTALVGGSGCGKSTIISLIERYYDPETGEILLDGVNLKCLNLKWLRTQVGLVGQEPALFGTTILENIKYGREDAVMSEIEAAAKAANIHSFIIQLPDGYQTQVGERGIQLSGGQKQRLAIARAILKNPTILLLDEATSALDTESERLVQQAIDEFMLSRTTVVVAHRLSTICNADKIVVLQKGQVLEIGSHDSLMKIGPCGGYHSLVHLQSLDSDQRKARMLGQQTKYWSKSSAHTPSPGTRKSSDFDQYINAFMPISPAVVGTPISPTSIEQKIERPAQFTQDIDKKPDLSLWMMIRTVKDLFAPKKRQITMVMFSSMFSGAVMPLFIFFLYDVANAYIEKDQSQRNRRINHTVLIMVCLSIITILSNIVQHFNLANLGEFLTTNVLSNMFQGLMHKEVDWYDKEENNTGAMVDRFSTSAGPFRKVVTECAATIFQTVCTFCVCVTLACVRTWPMALMMLAILPILILGTAQRVKDATGANSLEMKRASECANMIAAEAVNNMKTVASFAAEEKFLKSYLDNLSGSFKLNCKRSIQVGMITAIGHTVVHVCVCLAMYVAGLFVEYRIASFMPCLQVFNVLHYFSETFAEAVSVTPILYSAKAAFGTAFYMTGVQEQKSNEEADRPDSIEGRVEFIKVGFAYPSRPDITVLKDFSLKISAGKTVALVGRSGSGKSSVIALLQRFYNPQDGIVRVDKRDIRQLDLHWLRSHMALVQQEPVLFTTSVRENIRYGRENATEAEVREAAQISNADGFVSALPQGYDTRVGNRGVQLSGGQKQRIAIARAILKKPKILLLDEATSALDTQSEALVQEALEKVVAHSHATVIMVAHRLATVRSADIIVVLDKGHVSEMGSHQQLLQQRPHGLYAHLVHLQAGSTAPVTANSASN